MPCGGGVCCVSAGGVTSKIGLRIQCQIEPAGFCLVEPAATALEVICDLMEVQVPISNTSTKKTKTKGHNLKKGATGGVRSTFKLLK